MSSRYQITLNILLTDGSFKQSLGIVRSLGSDSFLCGICYSFPMYDIKNKKKLNVRQKPLIVMECSIIASQYEGLGYSKKAKKRFAYFKQVTHHFNGTFTLLWHNSHFKNEKNKEFYKELI